MQQVFGKHQLLELADSLRRTAIDAFQRRLLVISGEPAWCRTQAAALLTDLPLHDAIWVGDDAPDAVCALSNPAIQALLGSETETLVYDAFTGLDCDAFGAVTGTLRGGGLLILLTPPLASWSEYADPEHARIAVAGSPVSEVSGRFLERLARLIRSDSSVICVEEGRTLPPPPEKVLLAPPPQFLEQDCRTADQLRAVEALVHVVDGHRRRPVVLISDRGRGKSAALGIAAARLLSRGKTKLLVTAPRLAAVDSLFAQAGGLLPDAEISRGAIRLGKSAIRYSAPDHLLQQPQSADLLLVDEAAAIPTPLLEALLERYPRIAFATTIHGYEGTGQGFAVRFRKLLQQRFPQWREIRLATPIRWAPGDPLEGWLFRALALDATPPADALAADARPENCHFQIIDREQLARHEADLSDLFGLLVLAHYRTTPQDLRHLLDGPNLTVSALRHRGRILATALVAVEGGFEPSMAHAIWSGYRRPRGHLLAQSLAAHCGLESAASLHGARIMRIAVHPAVHRRGLGGWLVQKLLQWSRAAGLDYLGSSFGATPELLRFWQHNGLYPVHVGLRRGAGSGVQSVILLQPLSRAGERALQGVSTRFQRQLPRLLADALNSLDPELVCELLKGPAATASLALNRQEWLDVTGFAFARRGYATCLPGIEALTLSALAEALLSPDCRRLLVMRVLQHQEWQTCARRFGLAGRAGVEAELRKAMAKLVMHYADRPIRELALALGAERPE